MKCRKIMPLFGMFFFVVMLLTGCGGGKSGELSNELVFSLEGIEELEISYDDENISFYESEDDSLIVREYMSKDKKSYHAKVSENEKSIQISEGGKPFLKGGFTRYIEVYLPDSYSESLKVTTTEGNIDMSDLALELNSIRVDCTSGIFKIKEASAEDIYFSSTRGTMELGSLAGEQIKIETTQGGVSCEKTDGNVTYTSTSGNAEFMSANGSGTYKAENSGKLSVTYDEVNGDLYFFNKNDDVEVCLPEGLSFEFEAVTKNGSVNTDFQGDISADGDSVSGTVGNNPAVKIKAETKNGNIEVNR